MIFARFSIVVMVLMSTWSCYLAKGDYYRMPDGRMAIIRQFPVNYIFACDFPDKPELKDPIRRAFSYWETDIFKGKPGAIFREVPGCGVEAALSAATPRLFINWVDGFDKDSKTVIANTSINAEPESPSVPLNYNVNSAIITFFSGHYAANSLSYRQSTAAHEIGHFLGYKHIDDKRCLMYPTFEDDDEGKEVQTLCKQELELFKELYP